jgi:WD40 repeat protein
MHKIDKNINCCYLFSSFPLTGSLDSEAGIYALTYDITGTRLISCEADKTIKMWKQDQNAI